MLLRLMRYGTVGASPDLSLPLDEFRHAAQAEILQWLGRIAAIAVEDLVTLLRGRSDEAPLISGWRVEGDRLVRYEALASSRIKTGKILESQIKKAPGSGNNLGEAPGSRRRCVASCPTSSCLPLRSTATRILASCAR